MFRKTLRTYQVNDSTVLDIFSVISFLRRVFLVSANKINSLIKGGGQCKVVFLYYVISIAVNSHDLEKKKISFAFTKLKG